MPDRGTTRLKHFAMIALTAAMAPQIAAAQANPNDKPATPPVPVVQPTPNEGLRSPEIGDRGRVTFRIYAPNAHEVKLQAEGMEAKPGITMEELRRTFGGVPMTRAANGVWSVEFGPVEPGVYRYSFSVDGVQTTDPRNPESSESLTSVRSLYEVPGAEFLAYKPDVAHGAIASVRYYSKTLQRMRRMHVYTPPGYDRDNRRYPVLYLLHGGGDSDDSWPTVGRAGAILDNLLAKRAAVPMLVVMPAGHVSREFQLSRGRLTMGHDAFNDDLVKDVIPYVDQTYRSIADREHRAIAGLSMGGLQTLTISLDHPELFDDVGVFSSGWFPDMRDEVEKTDLAQYKASGKRFRLYWVGVARQDIAKENSAATVGLLKKYGIDPVTHDSEGFHAWNNWRDYLHIFAPKLFR